MTPAGLPAGSGRPQMGYRRSGTGTPAPPSTVWPGRPAPGEEKPGPPGRDPYTGDSTPEGEGRSSRPPTSIDTPFAGEERRASRRSSTSPSRTPARGWAGIRPAGRPPQPFLRISTIVVPSTPSTPSTNDTSSRTVTVEYLSFFRTGLASPPRRPPCVPSSRGASHPARPAACTSAPASAGRRQPGRSPRQLR